MQHPRQHVASCFSFALIISRWAELAGRTGHDFDLEALIVLKKRGIVAQRVRVWFSAGSGMAVTIEAEPAVTGCGTPQAIDFPSVLCVEGEVVESGLAAIVTGRRVALFEHDVGIRQFPADPVAPALGAHISREYGTVYCTTVEVWDDDCHC